MTYATFSTTRYTVGSGSLSTIGEYAGGNVALVVDSRALRAQDPDGRLLDELLKGIRHEIVCDMQAEPTMEMLAEPIKRIRDFAPNHIVAIGGGSVMDAAKALWLFYELPHYDWERAFAAFEVEPFPGKATLTVAPTTSGTGSETTGCAVIKDAGKRKRMILSGEILPTRAILDYDLLRNLPGSVIAHSGADALAHALEAATSTVASELVRMVCLQAAVTLIQYLPASLAGERAAREKIHVAATMAGAGIHNAITGMAHGMDAMGGDFNLPHGLVTGVLLPYTVRFLTPHPFYDEVLRQLQLPGADRRTRLEDVIFDLYRKIGMPLTLGEAGVDRETYTAKIPGYVARAKADPNILCAAKQPGDEDLERLFQVFLSGV
jgi:acetaldehyde dehydrogenase/alcohol dehydrogenase